MTQQSLYFRTQLEEKVSLLPEQVNGNMDQFLLKNLRAKVQGKTTDNGIVLKINRLIEYDYGIIDKTNFMGTTVMTVKYECFVCSPTKDLEIICLLDNIIKGYLIAKNGPIITAIQFNNIDTQNFEIGNGTIISTRTKQPVVKGDYLKVSIISININLGEKSIVTMCKLIGLASKEEIQLYEKDQSLVTGSDMEDDQEFI